MKVFAIPFGGGSANYYKPWQPMIDKRIELIPLELSGRGNRMFEPLDKSLSHIVDDVYGQIQDRISDVPYALFGHSMGALISFELAQVIRQKQQPLPRHIFLSGINSPRTLHPDDKAIHLLDGDDFKKEILEMGGTGKEIFEHSELVDILVPVLKNDLRNVYEYQKKTLQYPPLTCNFSVLYGTEDRFPQEQVRGWSSYTTGACEFYVFTGNHFFINEHTSKVISIINETLIPHLKS